MPVGGGAGVASRPRATKAQEDCKAGAGAVSDNAGKVMSCCCGVEGGSGEALSDSLAGAAVGAESEGSSGESSHEALAFLQADSSDKSVGHLVVASLSRFNRTSSAGEAFLVPA